MYIGVVQTRKSGNEYLNDEDFSFVEAIMYMYLWIVSAKYKTTNLKFPRQNAPYYMQDTGYLLGNYSP